MTTRIQIVAEDQNGVRAVLSLETDENWCAYDLAPVEIMKNYRPVDVRQVEIADAESSLHWLAQGEFTGVKA